MNSFKIFNEKSDLKKKKKKKKTLNILIDKHVDKKIMDMLKMFGMNSK